MINKEERAWKELCEECSSAAKEVGITKADTDRIIQETRKMQWKANKYDELIEKLEEKIKNNKTKTDCTFCNNTCNSYATCKVCQEILSFLKGE